MTTEIIDKLFLELSQVTQATTAKERNLIEALRVMVVCADDPNNPAFRNAVLHAKKILYETAGLTFYEP